MKAILHQGTGLNGVRLGERAKPAAGPGRAVVKVMAAALNHRDIWTALGRAPEEPAVVLGSDAAGVVESVGAGVDAAWAGAAVVIDPTRGWRCAAETPPGYPGLILGYPEDGVFADYVAVAAENLHPKPAHLSFEEAAALPIAALTTYRALFTEGALKAGESVVVPGIGAGTGISALQFAKAQGARVFVTSRAKEKQKRALALGAEAAFDSDAPWAEEVRRRTGGQGADLAIETVGAPTFAQSLASLRPGGRLVVFGATGGERVELDLTALFLRWIRIIGTTMGSAAEFRSMLAFVNAHKIVPVIDKRFALEEGAVAIRYLQSARQFGKVVLRVSGA